jgi:hypothetical protein
MAEQLLPTSVERDPVHGIDLKSYAQISARIAEGREPAKSILLEHGLDEMRWLDVEKTWLLRVAAAAMQGDLSLSQSYDEHYVAAQDSLGPTEPTHGIADLASVLRALSAGEDARDVLPRFRLTLPAFARLQRAWARRMAKDEALAVAFRDMLSGR